MAPQTTPALYETAYALSQLLDGVDTLQEVRRRLWKWARQNGFTRAKAGNSDVVWLGSDVVVKVPYRLDNDDAVPEEYRPEEVEAHTFSEGIFGRKAINGRVVVQPRYRNLKDYTAGSDEERAFKQAIAPVEGITWDAHLDNWGLRPDGSPVLFDW
jgi:hypothetical protein